MYGQEYGVGHEVMKCKLGSGGLHLSQYHRWGRYYPEDGRLLSACQIPLKHPL